jgi:hypothetical protein
MAEASSETLELTAFVEEDGDSYLVNLDPCGTGSLFRVAKKDIEISSHGQEATCADGRRFPLMTVRARRGTPCYRVEPTTLPDASTTVPTTTTPLSPSERVQKAKELLAKGEVYTQGCSGFVTAVLGIPWESANDLMSTSPAPAGDNNNYPNLQPGDIAGWTSESGSGHVAVFIGEEGMKFIDVQSDNEIPRTLVNGYGDDRPLYKSPRF